MTELEKQEFLASVIHELRAPLNACLMSLSLLEMKAAHPSEVLRCAEVIKRNLDRQALLIQDLADVLQIVSGGLELFLEPADAGELIGAAVKACRGAAKARRVELNWSGPDGGLQVEVDAERLSRTVTTLIEHEIQAVAPGGRVDAILGAAANGTLRLDVRTAEPAESAAADDADPPPGQVLRGFVVRLAIAERVLEAHRGGLRRARHHVSLQLPLSDGRVGTPTS